MTKIQIKFYNMLKQQIVDFDEIFHKDFMLERIEKIKDEDLKYLLENINTDKDKFGKKNYITYAKFAYYADKLLDNTIQIETSKKISKVDELYQKRELLLKTIEEQSKTISQRNKLIEKIQNKELMFKQDNKNLLDQCDYFIIEKFGFYNFFDENRNFHIKEDIENYLKEYILNKTLLNEDNTKKLNNI